MTHALRTQLTAQRSPAAGYRLHAVSADGRTAGFSLTPGADYLLARDKSSAAGREAASDAEILPIGFGRSEISACHALIRVEGDELIVRDLSSTNGTFAADGSTRLTTESRLPLPTTIHLAQEIVSLTVTHRAGPADEPIQQTRLSLSALRIGESLTIGRDASCDLRLNHPAVSRAHCRIERTAGAFHLVDHGSLNGTFLEDIPIRGRTLLPENASLRIGPFALTLAGEALAAAASPGLPLTVRHLTCSVPAAGGARVVLRDVSFRVGSGEFVAIIGKSGCGKTTLLDRLAGVTGGGPRGAVTIADCAIPQELPRLSQLVGHVPQQESIHASLTVRRALAHTIELRSPDPVAPAERLERITQVLRRLDLANKLDTRIDRLSGGERRRISLAAELLAQPKLLLLDEITSGLDARTARAMMPTLRALADAGTTIVCITHHVENVHLCDRVVLLSRGGVTSPARESAAGSNQAAHARTVPLRDGASREEAGRLAFFGTPDACLAHFGVRDFAAVLDAATKERCRAGALQDEAESPTRSAAMLGNHAAEELRSRRLPRRRHLRVLLTRQVALLTADARALGILIGQPLLVGAILLLAFTGLEPTAYGPGSDVWKIAFLLAVSVVWFATANAAREIVTERRVLAQERRAGLHVSSYLAAKTCSLLAVGALQTVLLLALVRLLPAEAGQALTPFRGAAPLPEMFIVLLCAGAAGTAAGLLLSALARSARQAVTLVPYLLLPQIILGGALVPTCLDGTIGGAIRMSLGWLMPVNWAYMGLRTRETTLPNLALTPPGFEGAATSSGGDPAVVAAINTHGMTWYADGRTFAETSFWLPPVALLCWAAVALVLAYALLRRSERRRAASGAP